MLKKLIILLSHLLNVILSGTVIYSQFLLASGEKQFTFWDTILTSGQVSFISRMCLGILTARVILFFLPKIKQYLSER